MRTLAFLIASFSLIGCQAMKPAESPIRPPKIEVHGHRGSRGTHPENTLPAFREAIAAKADVLEFDLQLTKENIPVVSHDPLLTGKHCRDAKGKPLPKPIAIRTLTLQQLKTYDCGSVPQERFPKQTLIPKTQIPTLEEVLLLVVKEAPHLKMNIETKMVPPSSEQKDLVPDPTLFAQQIIQLLRKHGRVKGTILQSFDFRTLEAASKIEPTLELSCLFEKPANFCAEALALKAQWISPQHELLTSEAVHECHSQGIKVVPWTANKPEEWSRLVSLGVDGIISDYPRDLIQYLSTK